MKTSYSTEMTVPFVTFFKNDKPRLIPSMVVTTAVTCFLITFVPQLMPVWMALSTRTWI